MEDNIIKKGLVITILLIFAGAIIAPNVLSEYTHKDTSVINGDMLYVGGGGTGNYTKIQTAIDDASNGDTIFVYDDSSPYNENLVINDPKTITLIGENRYTTVIDGSNTGNVITIGTGAALGKITIENFTITNSGDGEYDSKQDFDAGIHINGGSNHEIKWNNISNNNGAGIYNKNSIGMNIHNNLIADNDYDGIAQFGSISSGNIYNENTLIRNGWDGIYIYMGTSLGNLISYNNISGNGQSGVNLHQTRLVNIEDNYISNNDQEGIYFRRWCIGNIIHRNNITGNGEQGFFGIFRCELNTFWGNNFIKNKEGGSGGILLKSNVGFTGCFWNFFEENYFHDYNQIIEGIPYLIWGRIMGIVPIPNFDFYPKDVAYSYSPPPPYPS